MMRLSKSVSIRLAIGTVFVSGVIVAVPAPASAACENVWVQAYDVELEVGRSVYRVGDTARVEATVTRTESGAPVAGARFVAGIFSDDSFVWDVARTDAAGVAVAELRLKEQYVEPGPVNLGSVAYYEVADTTCATVTEYGEKKIRNAFTIRR